MEGRIFLSKTTLLNININRSPTSYLKNPVEERSQYEHDVDKTLLQLRFIDSIGNTLGAFHWFAVHATSMNNTNRLVSSDNLGYAALLLEKEFNTNRIPGRVSLHINWYKIISILVADKNKCVVGKVCWCLLFIKFGRCFAEYYGTKMLN